MPPRVPRRLIKFYGYDNITGVGIGVVILVGVLVGTETTVGDGATSVIGTGTAVTPLGVGDASKIAPGRVAVGMTLVGGMVPWTTGVRGLVPVGGGGGLMLVACAVEGGKIALTVSVGVGVLASMVGTGVTSAPLAHGVGDVDGLGVTRTAGTRVGVGEEDKVAGLDADAAVDATVGPGVASVRRFALPKAPAMK